MVKANGTDAKDIALRFIELTSGRATPQIMSKTIIQAKSILESGYTKGEIIAVLEHVVKKRDVYSLGYVSSCINTVLKEIKKVADSAHKAELKQQVREMSAPVTEVKADDRTDSTARNRAKSERIGVTQSTKRFKELFNEE